MQITVIKVNSWGVKRERKRLTWEEKPAGKDLVGDICHSVGDDVHVGPRDCVPTKDGRRVLINGVLDRVADLFLPTGYKEREKKKRGSNWNYDHIGLFF